MALLLRSLVESYNKALIDWAEPVSKDLPLVQSPIYVIVILFVYLLFCLKVGPKFMKSRKPYDIKNYIIAYDIFQILINGVLAVIATPFIVNNNWRCSFNPDNTKGMLLWLGYSYYLMKCADLLDTVFFVLKKNQRQVTFLHIYHHCLMVIMSWIALKYIPGGHTMYLPYINGIVHTVMYSYYLLCTINEDHRKNIWWKKHITQLQIVQFSLIFLIYFQLLFRSNCDYPKWAATLIVLQNFIVTALFLDFYYKTYIRKNK